MAAARSVVRLNMQTPFFKGTGQSKNTAAMGVLGMRVASLAEAS